MILIMRLHPGTTIQTLERIHARLTAFEQPLLSIGGLLSSKMATNFSRAAWPPLKESTLRLKRAKGYPSDSLVRSGAMKDAATGGEWQSGRLGGGSFMAILEIPGYSRFHQPKSEGGAGPTRFMPIRDFAFMPNDMTSEVADIVYDWVSN